jgi:ectoine hydroxylase-related dioxygenase (phytanoyl-CoA dioxygenase family)
MDCHVRGRPVPPELVGALVESTGLRRDPAALQARLKRDGYVFLRCALDPAAVRAARAAIVARLVAVGEVVPGSDAAATGTSRRRELAPDLGAFWQSVSEEPALRAVTHGAALGAILESLFGEPARAHDFLFLRAAPPGRATGLHFDAPFFTRATRRVATVWLSLGDTPAELGPLVVVENSHRFDDLVSALDGFDVARDTGRKATVDADPVELARARGTRLLTADFRAGDVLIFGMTLMHGSFDNHAADGRMRISCDVRWQPFSEPFDPRYMGPSPGGTTGAGYGELNGAKPLDQPWHVR